jgi:hypothetical protein
MVKELLLTVAIVLCGLSTLIGGCRPYHMYGGEFRSDAEVGTVTQTYAVRMMTVDGGDTGVSSVFKLLPGEHAIKAEVYQVGRDVELDRYVHGSANRMQGKFRWYVCTCVLRLDVIAGEAYELDGGEIDAAEWSVWAVPPDRHRPEHVWKAVEELDPARCICRREGGTSSSKERLPPSQ